MNILKITSASLACCVIACYLLILTPSIAHAETTDSLFNIQVVLPGMTETIDVVQNGFFPLGCQHFLVLVLGKGSLGISLKNDNSSSKETIFMLGTALSSAGVFPIYRLGESKGMIDQIVEIGDSNLPFGFVWLYCGTALSEMDPVYLYELRFSLQP